jgi:6-pyruvoyltetrahydropterin/6-carboxytetrahydropterin synthase
LKEVAMYAISKKFRFSASHIIEGLPADHPCSRLHGHNYEVKVELQSPVLDRIGFVRDFGELAPLRHFIDEKFDHRCLNEVFGHGMTTSEFMAKWFYDWCKELWPEVTAVRVSETPGTWAEYRRQSKAPVTVHCRAARSSRRDLIVRSPPSEKVWSGIVLRRARKRK